jgi:hypothetical protein
MVMVDDESLSPVVRELLRTMPATELLRIAPLPEAQRLSGLSADSLSRHHGDRVIDLGPRRRGMRIIDALMIKRSAHS